MMLLRSLFQAFFSGNYWRYTVLTSETFNFCLSRIGALWLLLTIARFFLNIPDAQVKTHWSWFAIVIALWTLWERRPLVSVSERLAGRDIELEIKIGDLLTEQGAKVISINTTFDTDVNSGVIAEDSLQGQFTRKFYNSVPAFDLDLDQQLLNHSVREEASSKKRGKKARYPLGTVVQVRPKDQLFYLVAIAEFNDQGVAQSSFDAIKFCLKRLWNYIGESGETEPIVISLMGSGRARLPVTRNEIAREIIYSFVECCASKKCCEKLTLIISPNDYRKHDLNLYDLGKYLHFLCQHIDLDRLQQQQQQLEPNSQDLHTLIKTQVS